LHWNSKKAKDRVFIKCADPQCSPDGGKYEWVHFGEITLSGFGKVKACDLMTKFMENKPYHANNNPEFKFRLQ